MVLMTNATHVCSYTYARTVKETPRQGKLIDMCGSQILADIRVCFFVFTMDDSSTHQLHQAFAQCIHTHQATLMKALHEPNDGCVPVQSDGNA